MYRRYANYKKRTISIIDSLMEAKGYAIKIVSEYLLLSQGQGDKLV